MFSRTEPLPLSRLMRGALALALGAALAVAPLTAPAASAEPRQAARSGDDFMAALVALGLIGLIIANDAGRQDHGPGVRPAPARKLLPAACLRDYPTSRGWQTMVGSTCVKRRYPQWRRLPRQCRTTIRVRNRARTWPRVEVYRPACLRAHGYHMTR